MFLISKIRMTVVWRSNKDDSHPSSLPGADVERPVDLEDPLDVQRLLPQPRPVGSTQEDGVPPHHWEHATKSTSVKVAWGQVSLSWRFISRPGHRSPEG